MRKKLHILLVSLFFLTCCVYGSLGAEDEGIIQDQQSTTNLSFIGEVSEPDSQLSGGNAQDVPTVYMTKNITPEGLMSVYKALGREATGKVAIKLHMGELGNTNYLSPDLIKDLVLSVNGTFVDSNTFYGGARNNTPMHLQVAKDHGFTYAPVDILDTDGEISLPINGGIQQKEAILGSHYKNYDFIISIAHFKGHAIAGFGGTFKNLAIGLASVKGKGKVHGAETLADAFITPQPEFLENVAEYTKAVADDKGDKIVYINVLNNLSVDCDCDGRAHKAELADIGILASLDPVALDKASVDQIYASPDEGKKHLIERIEARNGTLVLDDAEKLGVGSQQYNLVSVDG
ncbi:DUF362 domain-containing protein [uncultured Methanospirillum sp.]|uniref:DUF362 domain-containing protein n=1 Tax=uncultured Methanospirillum sp. TaxID=262503 RepID=UPI0029C6956F|nr:DUF362 domain-containing protein [uncultured Methanospirillum sp.]